MNDIATLSDDELLSEYKSLDHSIYELESYGINDMRRLLALSDEIDARGIDIHEFA
jgi:hypothetical protein